MREDYEIDKSEGKDPDWPSIMISALRQIVYSELYEDEQQ